jgi:hypothetical protein
VDLVYQTFADPAEDNVEPQLTETMLLERAMSERLLSRQGRGRIDCGETRGGGEGNIEV